MDEPTFDVGRGELEVDDAAQSDTEAHAVAIAVRPATVAGTEDGSAGVADDEDDGAGLLVPASAEQLLPAAEGAIRAVEDVGVMLIAADDEDGDIVGEAEEDNDTDVDDEDDVIDEEEEEEEEMREEEEEKEDEEDDEEDDEEEEQDGNDDDEEEEANVDDGDDEEEEEEEEAGLDDDGELLLLLLLDGEAEEGGDTGARAGPGAMMSSRSCSWSTTYRVPSEPTSSHTAFALGYSTDQVKDVSSVPLPHHTTS